MKFVTVCVEVSPLRSLPTTVCAAADSVVHQVALLPLTTVCDTVRNIVRQVALLPSFTGNLYCYMSGHCVPFLHW